MCKLTVDHYTHRACGHKLLARISCARQNPLICTTSKSITYQRHIFSRCPECLSVLRADPTRPSLSPDHDSDDEECQCTDCTEIDLVDKIKEVVVDMNEVVQEAVKLVEWKYKKLPPGWKDLEIENEATKGISGDNMVEDMNGQWKQRDRSKESPKRKKGLSAEAALRLRSEMIEKMKKQREKELLRSNKENALNMAGGRNLARRLSPSDKRRLRNPATSPKNRVQGMQKHPGNTEEETAKKFGKGMDGFRNETWPGFEENNQDQTPNTFDVKSQMQMYQEKIEIERMEQLEKGRPRGSSTTVEASAENAKDIATVLTELKKGPEKTAILQKQHSEIKKRRLSVEEDMRRLEVEEKEGSGVEIDALGEWIFE